MRSLKLIMLPIFSVSIFGCAPMATSFKAAQGLSNKDLSIPQDKTRELQCLDNQPDYILNTDIIYFQMTNKFGARVGVNPLTGLLASIGLGVEYSSGELSTAMHLYQPLNTTVPVSDRSGVAKAKKIKFDLNFGIYIVDAGFSYFTTTSLAALSLAAMKDNLKNIVSDIRDEWTTHVSRVYNASEIEIPVGYKAGVQAGDEFAIYDVDYVFDGNAPCQGPLKIVRRLSQTPIATAIVSQNSSASTSVLVVKPIHPEKTVSKYDLVMVSQLSPNFKGADVPRAALKRSVRIGPVVGRPILFDTGSGNIKVDITPFAGQQLSTIVNDPNSNYGFYLMQ